MERLMTMTASYTVAPGDVMDAPGGFAASWDGTLPGAFGWCRGYTSAHYENFSVLGGLLPRSRRDEYAALYAFARGADDLADEHREELPPQERAEARRGALERWRNMLHDAVQGTPPGHPAFTALAEVMRRHEIEAELFDRMIDAFQQDQRVRRYATWEDLRGYTRGSADPVGRWVLRLYDLHDPELDRLSDSICTGLQLVNFLQDITTDLLRRDRIYIPGEDLDRFQVSERDLALEPAPDHVRELLRLESMRAEKLLARGRPLLERVPRELRRQLILFHGGGRLALDALRKADYDAASEHRRVTTVRKFALLTRALRGLPL